MDFGLEVHGAGHSLLYLVALVLLLGIDNAATKCCHMAAVDSDDSP
tara:strand:- start:503 stop:640 length:138 start_codon:yes stop_codon:yes gene_type:complete